MTAPGATAILPSALPINTDFGFALVNFNRFTLDGAINASVTAIVVAETIPTDTPQDGWLTVDSEVIHYVSWATKTFTATGGRGAQGTTAASHVTAARVGQFITAQTFNQMLSELLVLAKFAALAARTGLTGSNNIDLSSGSYNRWHQLTGNVTLTITNPPTRGAFLFLILEQDGTGSRTITWSTTIKWTNGTTPTWSTAAGKKDWVMLVYDGTDWTGDASIGH